MRRISLFAEDRGHEIVLKALVERVLAGHTVLAKIQLVSVRGGFGQVQKELDRYIKDLLTFDCGLPDLVIVATDANCHGANARRKTFQKVVEPICPQTIYAIPDPHIERWLLRDPAAFKAVLGEPCQTVQQKCDRDRYKKLLIDSVRAAGASPLLGGMEYAEDIVKNMDLNRRDDMDGFGDFLDSLHAHVRLWGQQGSIRP
jgi:hypothetical protein